MNKILVVGVGLLIFAGVAFANYSFDFDISFFTSSFIVPLSGSLTKNVEVQQGNFLFFLADGSGHAEAESASTSLWDANVSSAQVSIEAVSLDESDCDVKVIFDGDEYDVNSSSMKLVFDVTSLNQRLSVGAYMNSEGSGCSGEFKDLNVVVP